MAALPPILSEGYARFRAGPFAEQQRRYQALSEGQSPATLIIACCDSRVDPAVIFDAGPGELFVVRNVANLVPPYQPDGSYHSTSAAIEFAVTGLKVKHILVMGHAQCGGIAAALDRDLDYPHSESFITKWMSMIASSKAAVQSVDKDKRQRALEEESVRASLKNLMTFPYVASGVMEGKISLHGAHFGIARGELTVVA